MVIKGARFRFRDIMGGKQRLAFVKGEVVEVTTFRKGKKKVKRIKRKRRSK